MSYRDLHNNIAIAESVRPQVISSTAVTGEPVDTLGSDCIECVVSVGAVVGTNDDGSIEIQESDVLGSGYTAVAAADLLGTEPTDLVPNTTYNVGYIGTKRYVKAVASRGTETSVAVSAVFVKGDLAIKPDGYSVAS